MDSERHAQIKREWAEAVDADDPDSLDDWPVDRIRELEAVVVNLIVAARSAMYDFETINNTLVAAARVHPFTQTPNDLASAVADADAALSTREAAESAQTKERG